MSSTATLASSEGRTPGAPARRATGRQPARPAPELAALTLDELRGYRQELLTEEARVSYWRRLLHARLDAATSDAHTLDRMRSVLSAHQSASQRLAVTAIDPAAEPPPLPDLAVLWEAGPVDRPDTVARLARAERELSDYRTRLHERIDAATGELIVRYQAEPSLALRALPQPRPNRAGSSRA